VKTIVIQRIIAKFIDLMIVFTLGAIFPRVVGPLLGFAYSLLADGIHVAQLRGQSIGKRVMGLKVIHTDTREPSSYKDSMIRNAPVGIVTFFAIIPVWGWVFLVLIGVPLMLIEIYLMNKVEKEQRLGDVMADTRVVPIKQSA
jgi:uncharacterized RDD family membrane protein YckC